MENFARFIPLLTQRATTAEIRKFGARPSALAYNEAVGASRADHSRLADKAKHAPPIRPPILGN